MPELPEVETIRRQLDSDLKGFTILKVTTDWAKSFRPSFETVAKTITGKKIIGVDRQAKLLIFQLTGGFKILFHLKLTGRLFVRPMGFTSDDYTRSTFFLKKGRMEKELRFTDARKFGFVRLIEDETEMAKLLEEYGPEPFKDLTLEKFTALVKKSPQPVKTVLLDQKKISGVGNIYANDALWQAKINPKKPAKTLTTGNIHTLYLAILSVLKKGLKYGGASDQWYRQAHGEEGKYQEHFLTYGRTGLPCSRCQTLIKRSVIGGRGTFYCPRCQV